VHARGDAFVDGRGCGVGGREVDHHVGAVEDPVERRVERGVGAPRELEIFGGIDGFADGLAHPPGGA
jgi:hypothetical protein